MSNGKKADYVVIPGVFDASWVKCMTETYEAKLLEANGESVFGDVGYSGREMHDIKFSTSDKLKLQDTLAAHRLYNDNVHELDSGAILASKRGQCSQPAHTDFIVTADELDNEIMRQQTDEGVAVCEEDLRSSRQWYSDGGFKHADVPCSVIVAVTARLLLFRDSRKFKGVHLNPGDVLCFRGDAVHAGAGNYPFLSWAWFFYMDVQGLYRPKNSTVLFKLSPDEIAQQKLAELYARDETLYILHRKGKKTPIDTLRAVKKAYSLTISDKEARDRLAVLFDASALLCRLGGPLLPTIQVSADKYVQLDNLRQTERDLTFLLPRSSPHFKATLEMLIDATDNQIRQCFIHCVDHYWFAEILVNKNSRLRTGRFRFKITSVPKDGACAVNSMALALQSLSNAADSAQILPNSSTTVVPPSLPLMEEKFEWNVDDLDSLQRIENELKRSVSPEYFVQTFAEALNKECLAAQQFAQTEPSLDEIGAYFGAELKQRCTNLPRSKIQMAVLKHVASSTFAKRRTRTDKGVTKFACFLRKNSVVADDLQALRVPFWELSNVTWSDGDFYKTTRATIRNEPVVIYDKNERLDVERLREKLTALLGCHTTVTTTLSANDTRNFRLRKGRVFVSAGHLASCAKQEKNLFDGSEDACISISLQGRDVSKLYRQLSAIMFPNLGPRALNFCRNHTIVLDGQLLVPTEGTLNAFACRQHPDGHDVSLQERGVMVHINPQRSAADVLYIDRAAFLEVRLRAIPANSTLLPTFQTRDRLKSLYVGNEPGQALWSYEPSYKVTDAPWAQTTVFEFTAREVIATLATRSGERWNLNRPGTLSVDISYDAFETVRCTCIRKYYEGITDTWACTLPLPSGAVQAVDVVAHSPLSLVHFENVDISQVGAAFPHQGEPNIVELVGLCFPASLPHTKVRTKDTRAVQETLTAILRRWSRGLGLSLVTAVWGAHRAARNNLLPQLPSNIWKIILQFSRPCFDQLMTYECIRTGTLLLRQNTAQLPVLDYLGQRAKTTAAWVAVWPAHATAKLECTENASGGQRARAHAMLLPANKAYTLQSTESATICAALFAQKAYGSCFGTDADDRVFRRPQGRPRTNATAFSAPRAFS